MDGLRSVPGLACALMLGVLYGAAHAQPYQQPQPAFMGPPFPNEGMPSFDGGSVMLEPVFQRGEQIVPPSGEPGTLPEPAPVPDTVLDLVEFHDVTVQEAMRILSDQSGLKIVPSSEAGKVVVSLYLRNVRARDALDSVTKANGLFYREDPTSGIIRVYTTEEYKADITSFRDEQIEVFTLLYPNPLDVALAIRGAFGTRVQLNLGALSTNMMYYQDIIQRFMRLSTLDQFNRQSQSLVGGAGGGYGGGGGGGAA
ncbi:MAG TPA: hypothetical protein VHV77_18625, partial [Pirellulales bacterium]|nr:hypothetical protein [Pirellulales bacterium]